MSAEPEWDRNDLDFEEVKRNWSDRGFSCAVWSDPPGQEWRDFVHDTDELLMVVDGEVELELRGVPCSCRAGEEVLIPAGVPHTVRNAGTSDSHWLYGYARDHAHTD